MTRTLVVHPGAIGDTLVALPILDALKRRHDPSHLTVIGHAALVNVLPGRTAVNEMRSIDGREFTELLAGFGGMSEPIKSFYQGFDGVVVWTNDPSGEIGRTLGTLKIQASTVVSPRLRELGNQSAVQRLRATLPGLTGADTQTGPPLRVTFGDQAAGTGWLERNGLIRQEPVVAVHPGGGSVNKCWASDRFAEVVMRLLDDGLQVVLIEGPDDEHAVKSVKNRLERNNVPILRGESLCTVMTVLSQCQSFLGNDSGVMHLAAALRIPTVAIFGPSDSRIWLESDSGVVAVRSLHPCGCQTNIEKLACIPQKCLEIPVETVVDAVRRTFSRPVRTLLTSPFLC